MNDYKVTELENAINTYFNTVEAIKRLNETIYELHNSIVDDRDNDNLDVEKIKDYRVYTFQLTSLQMNIVKIVADIKLLRKLLTIENISFETEVPKEVIDDIIESDSMIYSVNSNGDIVVLQEDVEAMLRDAVYDEAQFKMMISNMNKLDETFIKSFRNEQESK